MSRVLQAVDSIHAVGIYCLALVPPNYLPKTPLGGIHLSETKRRFLEGTLHPANVLLCPHTCVTNLPKPREIHSGKSTQAGKAQLLLSQKNKTLVVRGMAYICVSKSFNLYCIHHLFIFFSKSILFLYVSVKL